MKKKVPRNVKVQSKRVEQERHLNYNVNVIQDLKSTVLIIPLTFLLLLLELIWGTYSISLLTTYM